MTRRSPFDFDISVTADKKRRARARGFSGAVESSERPCDRPGCGKPGKFRAPKSPDNLEDFHWFCLDHVREYNLKWNFFDSHSDDDLERQFQLREMHACSRARFAPESATLPREINDRSSRLDLFSLKQNLQSLVTPYHRYPSAH